MKKYLLAAAAIALCLAGGTATYAAIVFDPASGQGFVGKGDVQDAFGWSNAQLQANAAGVTFSYTDEVTYDVPCMKETKKETMKKTFQRTATVGGTIAYDARTKKQVTGFNLQGYTGGGDSDDPVCPEGWEADGVPVLTGASFVQLQVHHNGVTKNLNYIPAPIPNPEPEPLP